MCLKVHPVPLFSPILSLLRYTYACLSATQKSQCWPFKMQLLGTIKVQVSLVWAQLRFWGKGRKKKERIPFGLYKKTRRGLCEGQKEPRGGRIRNAFAASFSALDSLRPATEVQHKSRTGTCSCFDKTLFDLCNVFM